MSTAATLPPASEVPPLDRASAPGLGPGPEGRPFRDPEPLVTVCVPMLDEAGAIEACLDGFAAQTHPRERLDVVVVDAGSTDGSRQTVEARAAESAWIRVVDNPRGKAAAAFNCGLQEAQGEVYCLFSAHGVPDPRFVERSVAVLAETGATGVGGRYLHVGTDRASNAVGRAMVSPVGMASPHRYATRRAVVDTISHPAYRTEDLAGIGGFDESLERNSDYEFNWRLRQAGRTLIFDPSVESVYRPRPSLKALGRQFWWYGRWKKRVLGRSPASLRPRHLVAPAFVASLAAAPVLAWSPVGRRLLAAELAAYAALVVAGTLHARPDEHDADLATLAACFPVMHACWGAGFLASVLQDLVIKEPRR